MRAFTRCMGIGLLALGAFSPGMAQSGGGLGGVVGGVVGGVGGTVGGVVGGVGGVVSGIGGTVGSVGGGVGGLGGGLGALSGPVGGIASTVNGVGGATQTIGGRMVDTASTAGQEITRQDIEAETESGLNDIGYSLWAHRVPAATLLDLRKLRLARLVAENPHLLEMDGAGNPTRRGRLIAIDPRRADLKAAAKAGFRVTATERDAELGVTMAVLSVPQKMTAYHAMRLIRRSAPRMTVEFDHLFEPAGGALLASSVALAQGSVAVAGANGRPVIGMIDGGVAQSPALATATIEQKGFAGPPQATGHGTAVASLIVGANGKFKGAAPGAALLVADVYGGHPAAGSALAVAKAMSWIAANRPSVINVSLVGPRNRLVERAVAAVQAKGIKVVAAVGNDGPAAPPLYPASQRGVIAVTAVDSTNRALAEAGRALHLDYSAPGADMAAALPGEGYAKVRGTSFAAPFVTSRLALTGSTSRLDTEADRKGFGRIGRGIICKPCRVPPRKVGAK